MAQNVTIAGRSYTDVPSINLRKTGGGTATFYDVQGSQNITANGTYDVTTDASVVVNVSGGGGKAFQWYHGGARVNTTSYTATAVTLTVEKSGTYNISWSGFRSSTSGTNGSQLYKNGSAVGTAQTTFTDSYWQAPLLTNQSLNQGDVLVVRARARGTSYYMCVANLIIEEV